MKDVNMQYKNRIDKYTCLLKKQNETLNFYSALRMIIFIAGVLPGIYFYRAGRYIFCAAAVFVFLTIFIIFVKKHRYIKAHKEYTQVIIDINNNSLKRVQGEWKGFTDTGEEFKDEGHRYSGDLDIFGEGSLFQWINVSVTNLGRKRLKEILTEMPLSIEDILLRQQGVQELSKKIKWRQKLNAEALVSLKENKLKDNEALYKWINEENTELFPGTGVIAKLLPMLTVILLIISFSTGIVSRNIPYMLLIVQMGILFLNGKKLNPIWDTAFKHKKSIILYDKIIRHIENEKFKSKFLIRLKGSLGDGKDRASLKINKLVKIVNLISDRNNMLYIVFNILFLWDINCVISLEKWKKESGVFLKEWMDTIGEFEALSSIAGMNFDNPDWKFPKFTEEFPVLMAKEAGHPLIFENNVCNDIMIQGSSPVLLITGSNMSGKSTYLRNAGLNMVLAYAGAPVNAKEFTCSIMKIFTCMRISDNLEKNISSFYAEILKIKEIVTASKKEENVFFLLDEIFRGTNSTDRHLGAKILISKLIDENTAGMVSTHDLELGEMERTTDKKVLNFHFEEYYKNGELHFDYKLRKGISETRNAMYLIKMAGIE